MDIPARNRLRASFMAFMTDLGVDGRSKGGVGGMLLELDDVSDRMGGVLSKPEVGAIVDLALSAEVVEVEEMEGVVVAGVVAGGWDMCDGAGAPTVGVVGGRRYWPAT